VDTAQQAWRKMAARCFRSDINLMGLEQAACV